MKRYILLVVFVIFCNIVFSQNKLFSLIDKEDQVDYTSYIFKSHWPLKLGAIHTIS